MTPRKKRRVQKNQNFDLAPSLTEEIRNDLLAVLYSYPEEFRYSYLAKEVFSKYVGPETDPAEVRRLRAIEKWLKTELTNARTNQRLLIDDPSEEFILPGVSVERFTDRVRRVVLDVIGSSPDREILIGNFSGGASTSKRRDESHPALKFLDKADATLPAWELFQSLMDEFPLWAEHINSTWLTPNIVDGNVLFTVPKTTVIDRVACKEPDLNMFLQKGVGNFIRRRLKLFGVNLNDQSINAELARIGSKDNSLLTIDLSSASDSVTTQFVYNVVPLDWFIVLDSIRSPITVIDGDPHENHMFSSMGNGFTFELESLLFYALMRATTYFMGIRGRISVYGDDLIMPSSSYDPMVQVLSYFGFTVNPDKSFYDGPFRESCGKHWYTGYDVTPFYIRQPISSTVRLIHFLNKLREWGDFGSIVDPRLQEIWVKYSALVPQALWGGQDYSSITALVSGDRPRQQLVAVVIVTDHNHIGGYLYWLRTASTRQAVDEPLVVSTTLVSSSIYRRRRNTQAVSADISLFS